ncbi:MAG: hypothetical protein JSS28_04245 [Proteobacteria bacterium]|nr:hypothetical protein [Pseudomonadota bacterium]
MNTRKMAIKLAISACLLQTGLATRANACSVPSLKGASNMAWAAPTLPSAEIAAMAAGAVPATGGPKASNQFGGFPFGLAPSIVGMWRFAFTAQGNGTNGPPDGTPIDAGFQTWHIDRTELMNSGRPPATGSFCEGVWEQQNWSSFSLNHWALSWDFDPATGKPTVFVGPTNIQEQVTVATTGNSFTGSFSLTQYAPDGTTVLGGVKGVVSATRVTVN